MASPYIRTLVGSFNEVYIAPQPGEDGTGKRPTQIFPAGGITRGGLWVPWMLNDDGTIPGVGAAGTAHFDDALTLTTPGAEQTLIDAIVPAGVTRSLAQALVITRVTGSFGVYADGELIGSGRTGPGCDGRMAWSPSRPLAAGTEYEIIFKSRDNSPAQDVEAYVQAVDTAS